MSKSWTIFNAAIACRRIFRKALTVSRLTQQEWAENRLAEFNLWAAGAGAYATEKASMDYRLRDNQDAHTILVNLLFMLEILVQKCIDEAHQADDSVPALSKVESTRMKDVEDSLNQLTRLTTAIRKAGIRSRLQKADSSFDPHDARIRSLRRHLECLVLVYPEEHGSSYPSEQQRDTARLTPIQLRLIDANLRRRNRFLYAQQHAQKLGIDSKKPENMSSETFTLVKQVPSLDVGEAATLSHEEKIITKDSRQVQSTTTATLVDEPIVIPPKEVVRSTTTVVSVTSSRISYPKPPPIKDNQELFRCPCCCLPLPIAMARGNQWKKHLAGDILPYTCILENCPQTGKFYMTKEAWLSHMDDEHEGREQWICHVCSQKNIYATFRESSEFTAHVEQDHSKGIKPQQIPMLLSAWRCKIPLEISTCPLCRFEGDDQNAVLDHIAEHIHSFSLRSLPWAPREGLEEENDEEESRSELSSNSPGMSSVITDTGSFAGDDFENPAESPRQQQAELTEDLLNQVSYGVSGQVNTSDWLAMLSNDPENPNPSPGNVLADWNVDDLPFLYKRVGPDWFAVFNTEVQRVLDVELVHHIVHDSVVCCVRFSWGGKYVATGCCGSAHIFDVATGQSVATLQDESVDGDIFIRSVCFSPDGEYLATGSEDNQIRIWDIATRSIKHVLTGHEEVVYSLDFAGNGRFITSGSGDKTVRIWDVLEGKIVYILSIEDRVSTVAISPNGHYIAAGALDSGVRIWDITTGYLVERLESPAGHKDCVYSVAFAPNGRDLVSGSLDKTIKIWELTAPRGMLPGTGVKGGKCVQTFEGHKDFVLSVCFTPDGRWVISSSQDHGVQFWDPTTGNAHMRVVGHKASVISAAPSPTNNLFATGSRDMSARIWRYSTKNT